MTQRAWRRNPYRENAFLSLWKGWGSLLDSREGTTGVNGGGSVRESECELTANVEGNGRGLQNRLTTKPLIRRQRLASLTTCFTDLNPMIRRRGGRGGKRREKKPRCHLPTRGCSSSCRLTRLWPCPGVFARVRQASAARVGDWSQFGLSTGGLTYTLPALVRPLSLAALHSSVHVMKGSRDKREVDTAQCRELPSPSRSVRSIFAPGALWLSAPKSVSVSG